MNDFLSPNRVAALARRVSAGFAAVLFLLGAASISLVRAQDAPPTFQELAERAKASDNKNPIIVVPGILGSELVNKHSGEKVWFSISRSKDDDLRLPISKDLASMRDNLVPGDALRSLKFFFAEQDFYSGIIKTLEKYGGYKEAKWDDPPADLRGHVFVFAYDWRRDNVETARLLISKIDKLKRKTGDKKVKFDIVAHSMGGLVSRYAAMYGGADLPTGKPRVTWAGASRISSIYMFGTPNHGAADSLQVLLEGFGAIQGINLPFVRDLSPDEVITMPSLFQLLPHSDEMVLLDENFAPIKDDIYDFRTWEKYHWSIYGEKDLADKYTEAEIVKFDAYLEEVLKRAKKFQAAIDTKRKGPVSMFAFGSECGNTLGSYVITGNGSERGYNTIMKPASFKKADGETVSAEKVQEFMFEPGDGRVTKRSLRSEGDPIAEPIFVCEKHDTLLSNETLQRHLLSGLLPK